MSAKLRTGLLALLSIGFLIAMWWALVDSAGAAPPTPVSPGSAPGAGGERQVDPGSPTISFIDSPTAQCYLPEPQTGDCYIEWQYLNVTASSSQYIISMTVSIDNRLRAYYGGFFQTSMYVPDEMTSPGFRVECGPLGASGNPDLGKSYSWVLRARETGGLSAANYGTVTCPADVGRLSGIFLPLLRKK